MASFTDSSSIQFPEYTSQQPVEAMVRVGMQKQAQFQDGISQVQNQVDNLLGLPIAKAEVQNYVKDQVGRLQTSIKQSISGDFSDQRLINQIGGISAKIANDPVIVNGVKSTAKIQKGIANLEQSKKDGKWSQQNEEYFNTAVSSWIGDGDVNSSFNGEYSPWVDYTDRFMKVYKELNPGEDINQDAFYIENGKIKSSPTLKSGITPSKIQNAWNLIASQPDVQNQLNIDGWYKFRGLSPQQIAVNIQESTNQANRVDEETIRALQTQVATNSSMNNPVVAQQIEELKQQALNRVSNANNIISALGKNPAAAKAAIVNQNVVSSLSGAFAYETLKKSPLWEISFQEREFQRKMDEFDLTFAEKVKMDDFDIFERTTKLNNPSATKDSSTTVGGVVGTTVVNAPVPQDNLGSASAAKDVEDTKFQYVQSQRELASSLAGAGKKPYILDQVTGLWKPNIGQEPYQFANEAEAEIASKQILAKGQDEYINGAVQDNVILDKMQKIDYAFKNLQNKQAIITDVQKIAAPQLNKIKEAIGETISKPVSINGRSATATTNDLVDLYIIREGLPGADQSKNRLDTKYGSYQDFADQAVNSPVILGVGSTLNQLSQPPLLADYSKVKRALDKTPDLVTSLKFVEDEYRKRQSAQITKDVTLPVDEKSININVRNFRAIANPIAQLNESSDKGTANEILALLAETDKGFKDNDYSIGYNPSTQQGYIQIRRGSEPATRMSVPANTFFQVFPELQVSNQFQQIFGPALAAGQGNTNYRAGGRGDGAFQVPLPPTSPNVVQYHLEKKGNNSYDVLWWVTPKPTPDNPNPIPIINGERANGTVPGFPQDASEAEVLQWTQQKFKDVNWLNKIIELKQPKK